MRRSMCALTVCLAAFLSALAEQEIFIDETVTWQGMVGVTRQGPTDLTSPVDYRNGNCYLRLEVTDKPSTIEVGTQICAWQGSAETCSWFDKCLISTPATYYCDLGIPSGWWTKDNGVSWTSATSWSALRVMVRCNDGSNCIFATGFANVSGHTPIVFKANAILVAPGDRLVPPQGWECPAEWNCDQATDVKPTAPGAGFGLELETVGAGAAVRIRVPQRLSVRAASVVNPCGMRVASIPVQGGRHLKWNCTDDRGVSVPPGAYLVRLDSASGSVFGSIAIVR